MHPALSIIIFTVVSGLGYGLAVAVASGLAVPVETASGRVAYVLALLMIVGGLIASTQHLGHPERAWRAFSQWRSSWLSREGVAAVVTFLPLGFAALGAVFLGADWRFLALIAVLFSLFTVYCTSMIYASLKTVHHWHSALTSAVFVALALAGGFVWMTTLAVLFGQNANPSAFFGMAFVALAGVLKYLWWNRADRETGPSTMESATGLGFLGPVRSLEKPHTGENYLTREMGFRVARKHAAKLRKVAIVFGFAVPFFGLLIASVLETGAVAGLIMTLSALAHVAGIFAERWLFFAEARHTVMLYYGDQTA